MRFRGRHSPAAFVTNAILLIALIVPLLSCGFDPDLTPENPSVSHMGKFRLNNPSILKFSPTCKKIRVRKPGRLDPVRTANAEIR